MTLPDRHETLPGPDELGRLLAHFRSLSGDFDTLFRRYGELAPAFRHYGLIQWQMAEIGLAIDAFRGALALAPEDADIWRDLAGAYEAASRMDAALSCIRMALHHRPGDARAWLLLANLDNRRGERTEAEAAFRCALDLDATLGDAHFGLGLLYFDAKRLDEAAVCLEGAIANGYANALGYGALGHLLYVAGRFSGCAAAFEQAARFGPLDTSARRKFARARTFETIIAGRLDEAMGGYSALAGPDAEDQADILRDAFAALSGYGHLAAAVDVGRMRLALNPQDAAQRYLLGAVSGEPMTRASIDYLESHFDGFAKTFDQKLVDVLLYRAPGDMARLVAGFATSFADVVDLGCGTGLAAPHLAPFGGTLTGVDISSGMLGEAAKRGQYAELVKAEIVDYLALHPARFDLVFAADVLIYFGDMQPFFSAAALATRPGGLMAMSVETTTGRDYRLLPSGRFAHDTDYIERLAARHFTILQRQAIAIRLEAGRPAEAMILVLQRCPHEASSVGAPVAVAPGGPAALMAG